MDLRDSPSRIGTQGSRVPVSVQIFCQRTSHGHTLRCEEEDSNENEREGRIYSTRKGDRETWDQKSLPHRILVTFPSRTSDVSKFGTETRTDRHWTLRPTHGRVEEVGMCSQY